MNEKLNLLLQKNKLKNFFANVSGLEIIKFLDYGNKEFEEISKKMEGLYSTKPSCSCILKSNEIIEWALMQLCINNISNEIYMKNVCECYLWIVKIKILDWYKALDFFLKDNSFVMYDKFNDKAIYIGEDYNEDSEKFVFIKK